MKRELLQKYNIANQTKTAAFAVRFLIAFFVWNKGLGGLAYKR